MLMPALLLTVLAVAALVHRRLPRYPLATGVAAFCTTLPGLLVFEVGGAARTEFMPFTLFVLAAWCLALSALAGLPFFLWRWHRGISMPVVVLPRGIPWTMLGGMLCGTALTLLPALLARSHEDLAGTLLIVLIVPGVLGSILAGFSGTLFLAAAAIASGAPHPAGLASFRSGALLAAGIGACLVLAAWLAPEDWHAGPVNRLMALHLNLALLLPAAAGWICGQRAGRASATTAAPTNPRGRSKVATTDRPADRQT